MLPVNRYNTEAAKGHPCSRTGSFRPRCGCTDGDSAFEITESRHCGP